MEVQKNFKVKEIYSMNLHDFLEIADKPYFRVLRVQSGWLYNFYNEGLDAYNEEWVFVPYYDVKKTNQ